MMKRVVTLTVGGQSSVHVHKRHKNTVFQRMFLSMMFCTNLYMRAGSRQPLSAYFCSFHPVTRSFAVRLLNEGRRLLMNQVPK